MKYRKRLIDQTLKTYLNGLPAVALVGAKGVGKTSTAKQYAKTILELDINPADQSIASSFDSLRKIPETPILIDEWSRASISWDNVRKIVDTDSSPNRFILTGSASKKVGSIHSGAGRIVNLLMRPYSFKERGISETKVGLKDILAGRLDAGVYEKTDIGIEEYAKEIYRSGFPGIRELPENLIKTQIDGYIKNIIEKDFVEYGHKVRKPVVLKNWLKAYAAATAGTASYETILNASSPGQDDKPNKNTTEIYRDVLDELYITDRVEAWLPTDSELKILGKSPKHFLVDPALSLRLLGMDSTDLLSVSAVKPLGPQKKNYIFGRLFEALVCASLKVYCQLNDADLFHFRLPNGSHEVDFIIEKKDTVIGIESKLSPIVEKDDYKHLTWLASKIKTPKKFIKMIINTGSTAYQNEDGVLVVPLSLLEE
jgi:predicted AAA+ superfamily ATPase